jgi:hypothetical protein
LGELKKNEALKDLPSQEILERSLLLMAHDTSIDHSKPASLDQLLLLHRDCFPNTDTLEIFNQISQEEWEALGVNIACYKDVESSLGQMFYAHVLENRRPLVAAPAPTPTQTPPPLEIPSQNSTRTQTSLVMNGFREWREARMRSHQRNLPF